MSDISTRLRAFAQKYLNVPHPSGWTFDTSAGADLSISIPETKIGVVVTGGAIYLKDKTGRSRAVRYGGAGASFGWQLVPLPFNFDFSMKEMPSTGVVYTGPFTGAELEYNELLGPCVIVQVSAQAGPGYSGALVFLGGNWIAANLGASGIILTCRAIVAMRGLNANLLPVSAGVSALQGYMV